MTELNTPQSSDNDAFMQQQITKAVDTLNNGLLVSLPTETVYGLGADAENDTALKSIFSAKGRPADHPLIIHIADAAMMTRYATDIPAIAWQLAEAFWPGPLTLILPRSQHVSDLVSGGQNTVGLRVPAHPLALTLLQAFGRGIAAPSANRFGRISPTTADHVRNELGESVNMILDGGPCGVGLESTILDLTSDAPQVLRPGGITAEMLAQVLGKMPIIGGRASTRTPGQLASHYSPQTPLRLVDKQALTELLSSQTISGKIGVLALHTEADTTENVSWYNMPVDAELYAQMLYASLHDVDGKGYSQLLIEIPPTTPEWTAVHDRLKRAATQA